MNPLTAGDIDLSSQQLQEIRMILSSHVPDITVWAFGSRVTGSARQYSDLDLALITVEPLPLVTKADLVACFSESNLPFKVDLVDWASTSDNFRKIILANKVVIQGRGTGTF
jgi:predicted nucleotidyltransferase